MTQRCKWKVKVGKRKKRLKKTTGEERDRREHLSYSSLAFLRLNNIPRANKLEN